MKLLEYIRKKIGTVECAVVPVKKKINELVWVKQVCDIWMKIMTNHPLLIGITEFRWENTRSFHARLVIENSDLDLNSSLLLQDISHFQDSWDYYSSNSATYQKDFHLAIQLFGSTSRSMSISIISTTNTYTQKILK
jgi:hypothetical protein